jgi:hypothetical protein
VQKQTEEYISMGKAVLNALDELAEKYLTLTHSKAKCNLYNENYTRQIEEQTQLADFRAHQAEALQRFRLQQAQQQVARLENNY